MNRKLCTIKLAKADTPAMPHTPKDKEKAVILVQNDSAAKTEPDTANFTVPARRKRIPAVRVIVALTLSSMFPIFRHFSAKMAIRQPMTPNTMPTIIKARTAWSRAGSQSDTNQKLSQHMGNKSTSLYLNRGVKMSSLSTCCRIKHC